MLMVAQPALAQTQGGGPTVIQQRSPVVNQAVHHDVSPPLYLIPPALRQAGQRVHPIRPIPRRINGGAVDSVVQESVPTTLAPVTILNFDGVGNGFSGPSGTFTVQSVPPDTEGDVGPNHYVQIVNTDFAVFNKSGTAIYGPVPINTLWSGFGGLCQTDNDGDPVVIYDPIADRWVISQFALAGADGVATPFLECVAVSQTPDPTGAYYRYSFQYNAFPDYPKMGVWPDAYYTTFNFFNAAGTVFVGGEVCAYDRASMLAGTAATQQCFNVGASFGGLLPADLDGKQLPPAGSPNYVLALGAVADLAFWKFHVDWTTPANTTLTGPTTITTAAYTLACNGGTCIPQASTAQQLDSLGDRLMFRLAYRNFGDHEVLVANHSVTAGSSVGVRWYEIRSPGATPTIFQQGTYAPDSNYRWMGSIAMDHVGDMAVGYSVSSSSLNPQIHYTGRLPSDALNTLEAEATVIDGTGSQLPFNCGGNPCGQRWGDYTSMSVDPVDDCTFWYSNEYLTASGDFNWKTHIGSFKFPSCSTSMATATLTPTSIPFNNQLVNTTSATSNVRLTNSGTAPLNITSITLTGTDPTQFALVAPTSGSPPCSFGTSTINANSSCFLGVQFKPTTAGARSANVSVADNASGSPQAVALTGTGIAPALTLSATSVAFGSVNVGATAPTSNVQLTNSGTATLNITSIMLAGTDPTQFALVTPTSGSPPCLFGANTISTGNSCFLGVQFKPMTAGAHSANVSVADDASGSPQTVALTGTGTDFSIGPATGGSTSATVTAGQTATYNLQVSPVSGFNGAVTFSNCSGAPSGAICTTSLASVLVNGTAAAFTVSVTTTAPSMIVPRTGPPNWPPLTGVRLIFLLLFALALRAILGRFRDAAKLPRPGLALAPALALVLLTLAWVGGCGGGGSSAPHNPGTPKGTSTLTVTATSGGLSHTQNLALTVN
jgi:hypothetical protein